MLEEILNYILFTTNFSIAIESLIGLYMKKRIRTKFILIEKLKVLKTKKTNGGGKFSVGSLESK